MPTNNAMPPFKYITLLAFFLASTTLYASTEFPFNFNWNQPVPPLIASIHKTNKIMRIKVDNDVLRYEDGRLARMWGVGLTFSGKKPLLFPPPKNEVAALVRKLKSYGFNHVRFVGFDHNAREPFRKWIKTGSLNSETMDKFDYLVSELRKAGIYYSLSINNNASILLKDLKKSSPNKSTKNRLWKYKYIRLYEQGAINRIVEWYDAFFSHINPYTGLSYAQDPANVYLASVNEDSIFTPFFRDFSFIDTPHKQKLDALFQEYLIKRYGALKELKNSWGEKCAKTDYDKINTIEILGASELMKTCNKRIEDSVDFLIHVDSYAANEIYSAIKKLGYQGLFTSTNNWYGYGNLAANASVGNYIDLHGYFDHPHRVKWPVKAETIEGKSYIAWNGANNGYDGEHSYPLSKAFRAALTSHPVIFSEWGHSGWSPHSYEGPLLLAAYSSFQGYPILDAHTFFSHPNPNPKDTHIQKALAINGNPVFAALSPSIALAFIRGDISSPEKPTLFTCANDRPEYLRNVVTYGIDRDGIKCGFDVTQGYISKVRTKLYSTATKNHKNNLPHKLSQTDELRSETGEIIWQRKNINNAGHFIVDTPNFMAAAVNSKYKISGASLDIDFKTPGAATVISLDNEPITRSSSILITTVRNFRNSGMHTTNLNGKTWVNNPGSSPVLLTVADMEIHIKPNEHSKEDYRMCAILQDGSTQEIDAKIDNITRVYSIGDHDTPWYWYGKTDTKGCDSIANKEAQKTLGKINYSQ